MTAAAPDQTKLEGDAMLVDLAQVRRQARQELQDEAFRMAVGEEKERIKQQRSWWERVFPWVIKIERRR
jgi:DNA-binding transcriptional regulator GbsR (MarR family)